MWIKRCAEFRKRQAVTYDRFRVSFVSVYEWRDREREVWRKCVCVCMCRMNVVWVLCVRRDFCEKFETTYVGLFTALNAYSI